jgi:hypothetical protein
MDKMRLGRVRRGEMATALNMQTNFFLLSSIFLCTPWLLQIKQFPSYSRETICKGTFISCIFVPLSYLRKQLPAEQILLIS